MSGKSRTEKSIRNLIFAWGGQGVGLLLSMISRAVFVRFLAVEYLGLTGLFSNILTMLSLVELGIGPAMTYSLYKPLAENNKEKIKSLMRLYKLLYRFVGIAVFVLGIIMLPFYRFFIKDVPNITHLDLIFFLYVANTGVSYFYSYRRALIDADQNRYITISFQYLFLAAMHLVQIIELVILKDYIGYMIIQVCFTWLENYFVSRYADKKYSYLKEKNIEKISSEDMQEIKKNVGAMIFHKVGSVVVLSTDNILISKMLGLVSAGLYANYSLLTKTINNVLYQVFNSIVASVGNLRVFSKKSQLYNVFQKVFFLDFWMYGFVSICLFVLVNPFVKLWLGSEYILDSYVVMSLVGSFYLYGMLKAVRTFRDAAGLYYADRYKPVFEVIINLVSSILLVRYMGMTGIFVGTIISTITTCFWVEPWILFKNCFDEKVSVYFWNWIKYTIYTLLAGIVTKLICGLVGSGGLLVFIIQIIICCIVPNVIFLVLTFRTEEFCYYKSIGMKLIGRRDKK